LAVSEQAMLAPLIHHVIAAAAAPSGIEGALLQFVHNFYTNTGYLGVVILMALESCCIPLPSEIVMPLAGYFAFLYPERFNLPSVAIAGAVGCLIGSTVAYAIGASGGRPLLLKYGKYILISKADSDRADRWFAKYGAPVAFFSRLLPVIRTYISLPAGITRMSFWQFSLFTLLGSLPWTFLLALIGYNLGDRIVELSSAFHGADFVILGLLVLAVAYYIYRHIKKDREATNAAGPVESPAGRR
jgi:membrane protein DedA with SNARE-associated domain